MTQDHILVSPLTSACPKFGANQSPDFRPADPGDTAADSLSRVLSHWVAVSSFPVAPASPCPLVVTSRSSFRALRGLLIFLQSAAPDRSDRFLNFDLSQPLFPETLNLKP